MGVEERRGCHDKVVFSRVTCGSSGEDLRRSGRGQEML